MKNKVQTQEAAAELPNFLNDVDDATEGLEELLGSEPQHGDDADSAEEFDGDGAHAEHADYDSDDAGGSSQADDHARPGGERRALREHGKVPPSGGGLALLTGGLSMAAGVGLGATGAAANLATYGLQPATLLILGGVMLGVAFVRRHLGRLEGSIGDAGSADTAALRADVQHLIEAQRAHEERAPAAGEELQHVLLLLQRQDEKINNLTKAIKMYGKPLMDIAGQTTELAGALSQLRSAVDGSGNETRAALARVEAAVPDTTELSAGVKQVLTAVTKTTTAVDQLAKSSGKETSIEPLQQQAGRIEVAVQALAQRLEDTEVRRSLVRLEDAAKKAQEEMHELLRGEKVSSVGAQLQKTLDAAATRLLESIGQLRDGNLGSLESSIKEIHREVTGVATVVHQIQTSVRNGARPAAAATPPAQTASAGPAAAAAPAPTPSPTPAPATPAAPAGTPAAAGGYQTGARNTSGKNVLGAIAKLKQMKS